MSDPADELSPLQWCITAMNETTGRLTAVRSSYPIQAITAVGEAVWRVTIVDATLLRHHPQAYDRVMASQPLPERTLVEGTLAGLRFIRTGWDSTSISRTSSTQRQTESVWVTGHRRTGDGGHCPNRKWRC
jgi:hypothetical protein